MPGAPNYYAKYVAESFSYDPAPQAIDPAGYACQESPLPAGGVLCRQVSAGYAYDVWGNAYFERHATFFSYDRHGRLVRKVGPVNLDRPSASDVTPIEERTYWPETEALARRGRLMAVKRYASTSAPPLLTSYDYDAFGPYQITQPNGAASTIVKDSHGRPVLVVGPDGQPRETRYHDGLDPRLQLFPSGAAVRSTYDTMGRLSSVEYLSGDPEQPGATPTLVWGEYYSYDAAGNRVHTERRDASGNVTWQQDREYDVQHRLVRETNPENAAASRALVYDASGFLASVTDEEGRVTAYTPDGLNRVKKVRRSGFDAQGAPAGFDVAQYTYRFYGDGVSKVVDGKGIAATYQQDDFGRLAWVSSPDIKEGAVRFLYDARGNVVQRKANHVTVSYTYDGLDRLVTVNATNTVDRSAIAYTYRYDEPGGVGQLTSIIEPERTVSYGYDAAGRLTSETIQENGVAAPLVIQYVHDADGAVSDIIYPSGLHIVLARDPATRAVTQIRNAADGTVYADQVMRLPGGPVGNFVFGNGLALAQTFNHRYEPQAIASGPLSLGYGMTPAGDVASISDGSATRSFRYDFLDRLAESPGWLAYGYDNNGNRVSENVEGMQGTDSYTYDTLTKTFGQSGAANYAYAYDYQTNVSAVGRYNEAGTAISAAMCLRHDALGRMTLVGGIKSSYVNFTPGGTTCYSDSYVQTASTRFKYDARNRRIARWQATTNQWFYVVSDGAGNPLSELALTGGSWTKLRDYLWLDGRPLAQIEYPGPGGGAQGYVYYYHLDHIGLPRALTNQNGQVVWSTTARPYGDIVESATNDPLSGRVVVTNLRLPGQYDERLFQMAGIDMQGPYYNWNRWYLPSLGRYMELDPWALQGEMNSEFAPDWYNYAEGNPLRKTDRNGLAAMPKDPCKPRPKSECAEHGRACMKEADGYRLTMRDCLNCRARCETADGEWPWYARDFNGRRNCDYLNPGWDQ